MTETRRMHYVPKVYLDKFAQQRGNEFHIGVLDKQNGKIFNSNTKKICIKNDLYLLQSSSENQRQLIEKLYDELFESRYNSLYKILVDDNRNMITLEERYSIISFVVSLFYRNIFWNVGYNKLIDQTLSSAYKRSKAAGKDSFFFGEQEVSIAGKSLEQLQKENREMDREMIALKAIQKIFELTRIRLKNDVIVVVKTEDLMVTSDNPVIVLGGNAIEISIPFDLNNTLSLPVDDFHLLQLRPWAVKLDSDLTMLRRIPKIPIYTSYIAKSNNQLQYQQAERFVLGSDKAIILNSK